MTSTESKALEVGIWAGGDEAQSIELDADMRGFTGLLVGLAIGIPSWGLILMLWWLV